MADLATPHEFFERLLSGPMQGRRKLVERLGLQARDPIEELLSSALEFEANGAPRWRASSTGSRAAKWRSCAIRPAPLDAVRVMTVHGSKGLEAPVVILADALGDPDRAGPGARFAPLPIGEDLAAPVPRPKKDELVEPLKSIVEAKDAREREEHWRLLYVAMTRAKERLFVGGALASGAKGPPEASWFGAVEAGLAALGSGWEEDPHWGAAMTLVTGWT
jgi:ATP-dependent helicase/nuclease subunit A